MVRILIVDDEEPMRELLHSYLERDGYEIVHADSGYTALAHAAVVPPDLVLCDVTMSGMDGFTVCRKLKEAHRDELLPVILVTAYSDKASRVNGLEAGADEFLTKPVNQHELDLRVTRLLALQHERRTLARRNLELAELQRFRDEISAMVVHDLKNPVAALVSNMDFLAQVQGEVSGEVAEALADSRDAARRVLRLLGNLGDTVRAEAHRLSLQRQPVSLDRLLTEVVDERRPKARVLGLTMICTIPSQLTIHTDADLLSRVLENVLDNAFRHTSRDGTIAISAVHCGQFVSIRLSNTGPAIATDHRAVIFEKFGHAKPGVGRMNLGLGLYFCRLAVEALGGTIRAEESADYPTVFVVDLPITPTASAA